jgi:hypothetical protein
MSTFKGQKQICCQTSNSGKKIIVKQVFVQKCEGLLYSWTTVAEWSGVVGLLEGQNRVLKSSFKNGFTRIFSLFYVVASCAGGRLTIGIGTAHCVPKYVEHFAISYPRNGTCMLQ